MKKIFLLSILFFSVCAFAQKQVSYWEVIQVDGSPKNELLRRASAWMSENFNDQGKKSKKEPGTGIKSNSDSGINCKFTRDGFPYSITVQVKDGRYRYMINADFLAVELSANSNKKNDRTVERAAKNFYSSCPKIAESLKKAMLTPNREMASWSEEW